MSVVYAAGGLTLDWVRRAGSQSGPNLGGNAAYAAVGAYLTGATAEIVAVVGADFPSGVMDDLVKAGIGVSSVRRSAGPSFQVLLDDSGTERAISYLPGSGTNADLDPLPFQLPADLQEAGLHICAIPAVNQRALIGAVTARTVVTLDTVHIPGQIEPRPDELIELSRRADTFLPSREEAERFWPGGPERALRTLAKAGVRRAVVKVGAQGSVGMDGDHVVRMPAAPATVVDTTGAGDAYCGAYCAARVNGQPLRIAMAWGAAAASVLIEGYGLLHALQPEARSRARLRFEEMKLLTEAVA